MRNAIESKAVIRFCLCVILGGAPFIGAFSLVGSEPSKGETGADHWSFQAPEHPEPPEVENEEWPRNSIDAFLLARMEEAGFSPSPPADRSRLIRRLYLDLLGLLPSAEAVAEFENDSSPDAYEKLVDRILASPHFGERWGRHWLDQARYADSDGYEKDRKRPYAYLYRDWVIEAYNRDLPFDRFTIQQLAGDLLPNSTKAKKIATGFHRNTLKNREGGVDPEEDRVKIAKDRTSTTATVWLGLTLKCAECHDHKYDPISQKDYYQFYAFFNRAKPKEIPAPQPGELKEYRKKKADWDAKRSKLKHQLEDEIENELPDRFKAWQAEYDGRPVTWEIARPSSATSKEGAELTVASDGSVSVGGKKPSKDVYKLELPLDLENSSKPTALRLEVLPDESGESGPGRTDHGNFVLSELKVTAISSAGETSETKRQSIELKEIVGDYGQEEYPVADAVDGDVSTGWGVSGATKERHAIVVRLAELPDSTDKLRLTLNQQYGSKHTLKRFRVTHTTDRKPLKADLRPDWVHAALQKPQEERSAQEQKRLLKYYQTEVDPVVKGLKEKLAKLEEKKPSYPPTEAMTMVKNEDPPETHIHERGDFRRKKAKVQPDTPDVLNSLQPRGEVADRLDLARWIVSPENPLTSRVVVNRAWRHLFGRALVKTDGDFGLRSAEPTHPKLLDWLATTFQGRLDWHRKRLIKMIVMSAAYRQSSRTTPKLLTKDPNNTLFARQGRFRVSAEVVRDIALDAGGLLNPEIGGPSIYPELPGDVAALGYGSVKWNESKGGDQYRRGVYIQVQRSVMYPMLKTFDAPDSTTTCTRRKRTNTPLQALTLLNSPVFFECAQALGKRLAKMPTEDPRETIKRGFERCLARSPSSQELQRLTKLYRTQKELMADNNGKAAKIAGLSKEVSESKAERQAAFVMVSRTIMNLDEFMTRE